MEEKKDEWSAFADMLGNLIAKYYDVLDIDSLPDPRQDRSLEPATYMTAKMDGGEDAVV